MPALVAGKNYLSAGRYGAGKNMFNNNSISKCMPALGGPAK